MSLPKMAQVGHFVNDDLMFKNYFQLLSTCSINFIGEFTGNFIVDVSYLWQILIFCTNNSARAPQATAHKATSKINLQKV